MGTVMRIGGKLLHALLWIVAGLSLLALALVLALRTAPGRRALLRLALPALNARLAGHLEVRGLDGDLIDRLVLIDARLDDAEGAETLYAHRIEVRLDWRALWHRRVHVRDLRLDGARLTLRHLSDNRFNLAALGKPRSKTEQQQDERQQAHKSSPPPLVELDHFRLQLDGAYHPPRGHEAHQLEWPRGSFDIEGAATFRGADIHIIVTRLVSEARDPLHAHVELRGGLHVMPHGTPVGKAEMTFENVAVTVVSDGDELARLDPRLAPRGRWALHAEGGGPLSDLHAHAVVSAPTGSVTVDGSLGRMFPGVHWHAEVAAAGLDPGADWQRMPPGLVELALSSSGARNRGEVSVARLHVDVAGVRLAAHGHSDLRGHGAGTLQASIASLARLGDLGIAIDGLDELAGRVQVQAELGRDQRGPRLDATVGGERLWLRQGRLRSRMGQLAARLTLGIGQRLRARVVTRDLELDSVGVAGRAQPFAVRLADATLLIQGQPRRLRADATARMADGTRATTTLHARIGDTAADVRIDALAIARHQRTFTIAEPMRLHVSGTPVSPHLQAWLGGARADARLHFGHRRFSAEAAVDVPDLAQIGRLSGGAEIGGVVRMRARVELGERLTIDTTLDGEQLRGPHASLGRVHLAVHSVDLRGDARVAGERLAFGPLRLSRLALRARGGADKLRVTLDGVRPDPINGPTRLQLDLDGRWHTDGLRVVDADLLVRAVDFDLPRQSWRLVAPAHLVVHGARAELRGLRVRSGMGELGLDGRIDGRAIDVVLALQNGDLEQLSRAAGHPGLLPQARWSGRLHLAGTTLAPLVEASIEARSEASVTWYGLGFNTLSLTAYVDGRNAILHADAHGRLGTRVVLDVHGAPRRQDGRFVALAATLDRVEVAVHGHRWQLRAPCTVDVAGRLAVSGCTLGSGRAEISVGGAAPLSSAQPDQRLEVDLATHHLDLRDLHALLAPGHEQPPKTDFDLHVHLSGTRAAPVIDGSLAGRGSEIDEGGLPENVDYRIRAHYADHRISGEASMRQVGLHLGTGATFDLPTTLAGDQPIHLALEARPVPFFKIRNLLPTPIANLKGFFTLRVNASGTTRHPRLTAEAHLPSWALDHLKDNNTVVNLAYDGRDLRINSVTSFAAQGLIGSLLALHPPRNSGTVTMELRAPIDLVRFLQAPRDAVHALVHDAPLTASAEVRNVDLDKVPLQSFGWDSPLTLGHVDAAARLEGTLHHPSLHVDLHATNLARPGVIDHLDLDGSVQWEHDRLRIAGQAALRAAPLLTFAGDAELDARALIDGDHWQSGALGVDIDVARFGLERLRNLQPRLHAIGGAVSAHALVRGTWGAPDLRLVARARDVTLSTGRFGRLDVDARLHQRRWSFVVDGEAAAGGRLHLDGSLSRDRSQPLAITLDAHALDIGFLGATWEQIGELHGTLGAHLWISGTRQAPRPNGWATLDDASFRFRYDSRRYTGSLALRLEGQEARLTRLSLAGGGGTLDASGRARLDGLTPTALSIAARARTLELDYGSAMARLDADFHIAGDRSDGIFRGQLQLARGTIRLPDLSGLSLASPRAAALGDVRFDDSRARGSAAGRSAGRGVFIAARIDGPIELRSHEADLDLVGELGVTVASGALGVDGIVESKRGTMELLGHRYEVERAQLAFSGSPNDPELHLRATRRLGTVVLAMVIEGTAQNPSVRLSCEPPIYDQAQLVSLALAGRPATDRVALHDLNRQITGLLSAVVIRKIEEELAPSLPMDVVRPLDQQSYAGLSSSPLEVGRFVSDRVYVRYGHRYGSRTGRSAANSEEASAEYGLGRGFQIDTTFGDAGVGGIYLFWTTTQ